MRLIIYIFLKTTCMKTNWKKILLYIVRIIEMFISGAAGGALGGSL